MIPRSPGEQWLIYPQANGTVEIQNLYTSKFLEDPHSTSNLTGMVDFPWTGEAVQQWYMVAAGSGPTMPFNLQNASSGAFDPKWFACDPAGRRQ